MLETFLIAFFSGLILNAFFLRLARRTNLFKKRLEAGAFGVSKLGGVALALSFFLGVKISLIARGLLGRREILLGVGLAAAFLLGLADDLLNFEPLKKLFLQLLIALFFVFFVIKTQIALLSPAANAVLSILWFLLLMNAFNFLDILDGLAAGISVLCAATFLYLCAATKNMTGGVLAAGLLASNLSFLFFNVPPARLYMGDMGSLFNGCGFAALAILISYATQGHEIALFVPLLVLALPLYDLFFVMVVRWSKRKPLTKKSRDHFVLRLMDRGMPLRKTVFLMCAFNFLFNAAAVLLLRSSNTPGIVLLLAAVSGWLVFAYKITEARTDGAAL